MASAGRYPGWFQSDRSVAGVENDVGVFASAGGVDDSFASG